MFLTFWFVLFCDLASFIVAIVALHIHWAFLLEPAENGKLLCGLDNTLLHVDLGRRAGLGHLHHSRAGGCLPLDTGDAIVDFSFLKL